MIHNSHSLSEGNGHYRAAGPHVIHQLLEEIPQHHLWPSPHWSATKCKYRLHLQKYIFRASH